MVNATTKEGVPVENANPSDEPTVLCIIKDETTSDWKNSKHTINLPASTPVQELITHAAKEAKYVEDSFLLVWSKPQGNEEILLNAYKDKTLQEVGLVSNGKKNSFLIKDKDGVQPTKNKSQFFANDYEFHLGKSSSCPLVKRNSLAGFVGLVNQAMTCYLNSLLQTLFMTPEFRNAIYSCLYISQASSKRAVETTDVTKSFGWDSSEAWQQHDVQELCRVMFDALESKFKNTVQDDLINKLYQGKLKDYVKCQQENALQNFIAPEVLDETNQVVLQPCSFAVSKPCPVIANKLFSSPKIFLLDSIFVRSVTRSVMPTRMMFPEYLYLKDFVSEEHEETDADEDSSVKGDSQSSTETDSGVSEGCSDNGMSTEEEDFDNARGGAEPVGLASENLEESEEMLTKGITGNMKVCETLVEFLDEVEPEGPYCYELFSIMIHSGSATGGHYYAYIKSFETNQWYCFNDQSVTRVYDDDIERTYGGVESSRHYYSSAYTSSTNAYMLMYRKVAPERNAKFMELGDVPKHIAELIHKLKNHEEMERRRKEMDRSMCKIKIFCENPLTKKRMERKLEIHKDKTLEDAVSVAHKNDPMGRVLCGVKQSYMFDLLLETIMPHESFVPYKSGGTTVKVHVVDLQHEKVAPPVNVRPLLNSTAKDLHILIHEKFDLPLETLRVVLEGSYNELKLLDRSDKSLKELGFFRSNKIFVDASDVEMDVALKDSKLLQVLDLYQHTIQLCVILPDPSRKPTENMSRIICETDDDLNKNEKTSEKLYPIDKRITLGNLKEILQSEVGCSPEYFRVYRVYSSSQEIEYNKLSDQLTSFNDDAKPVKYLFDWIVGDGMTVKQCKELLHPEICERCDTDIPLENLRLRRKSWKNPGRVYTDEQVFEDSIKVFTSPERMTSTEYLSLYLRQWHPSTLTVDNPKEVVLKESTVEALKEEMSELSGIPVEDLELCKGHGQFPCEASILEIHGNDFGWASDMLQLRSIPLLINDDGAVVYYRCGK
ncbi:Ubiquitin carboxyl-terminal hydrolase 47 [Acropora cervicornis]|uniref:Ubiquitin carboxyl-terminal hydrolase n=1 Tax=Acropora cervicornis TaxID=6130 RepID=A0AAD9QLS3_ACRCE|nr:Ubiquitin carboxyl-terminal hydrolase 47 [Acropora cervicornis]